MKYFRYYIQTCFLHICNSKLSTGTLGLSSEKFTFECLLASTFKYTVT